MATFRRATISDHFAVPERLNLEFAGESESCFHSKLQWSSPWEQENHKHHLLFLSRLTSVRRRTKISAKASIANMWCRRLQAQPVEDVWCYGRGWGRYPGSKSAVNAAYVFPKPVLLPAVHPGWLREKNFPAARRPARCPWGSWSGFFYQKRKVDVYLMHNLRLFEFSIKTRTYMKNIFKKRMLVYSARCLSRICLWILPKAWQA